MRASIINLVSLVLVLLVLYIYLRKGLRQMIRYWKIIQYWTAFALLSTLFYQFLASADIFTLSSREKAYLYWMGYYLYDTKIWLQFLPYVMLFFFSIILKESFESKLKRETQDILLNDTDILETLNDQTPKHDDHTFKFMD